MDRIKEVKDKFQKTILQYQRMEQEQKEMIFQLEKEYSLDLSYKKEQLENKLNKEIEQGEDLKSLNTKLIKEGIKSKEKQQQLQNIIDEGSIQNEILEKEIQQLEEKMQDLHLKLNS